jgi:tRNA(Ile)-lysidine synthase
MTLKWLGEKPRTAIQASARRARYDLMTQFCLSADIPAIATAHTSDDQAETLIMRLARGSGLDGLAAMAPVSRWDGIDILRPLLTVSRRQIAGFLNEGAQPWLDDPSNDDARHERVRIRQALKVADALGLSREKLALSARRLTRARDAIDAATTDFLRTHSTCHAAGFAELPLPALIAAPEEIALRALARMIAILGGASPPPQLAKLESCFAALKGGLRAATLGGCHLTTRADRLVIIREFGRLDVPETVIHPGEGQLWDRRFQVTAGPDLPGAATLRPLGSEGMRQVKAADAGLGKIPRQAAMTLPSLWRAERLCFAPFAVFAAGAPAEWSSKSRAELVVSEAFCVVASPVIEP